MIVVPDDEGNGGVILVLAVLLTATFVVIPARYRYWRLTAVLGWVAVWADGHARLTVVDVLGLGVAVGSVAGVIALQRRRAVRRQDSGKTGL